MMGDNTGPLFLLGSERSGTNLLRRRLSEHQDRLIGPPPLHLLKHLYHAEPYYGDLQTSSCFQSLVTDALGLAYQHFAPWDVSISPAEVMDACTRIAGGDRSVVGLMHTIYSLYAEKKGRRSYFCKDNNLYEFVFPILARIPEARFVFLHRDPRDVVASQLVRPTQKPSVAFLADLWRREQLECIRHANDSLLCGKVFVVSYRDLITNEADTLRGVIEFLGERFREKRDDALYAEERTAISEWENISKETMADNFGKYRQKLTAGQLNVIEAIVWHQMNALGYDPENVTRPGVNRVRLELDHLLGKTRRALRRLALRPRVSEGQVKRTRFVQQLRSKFR